jgi:hypothetical protein
MTLRELGEAVGADYPAVSKAILRVSARLPKDRALRHTVKNLKVALSCPNVIIMRPQDNSGF